MIEIDGHKFEIKQVPFILNGFDMKMKIELLGCLICGLAYSAFIPGKPKISEITIDNIKEVFGERYNTCQEYIIKKLIE